MDEQRKKDGQEHHHHHHHRKHHRHDHGRGTGQHHHHHRKKEQALPPESDGRNETKQPEDHDHDVSPSAALSHLEEKIQAKTHANNSGVAASAGHYHTEGSNAKFSSRNKSAHEYVDQLDSHIQAKLVVDAIKSEAHPDSSETKPSKKKSAQDYADQLDSHIEAKLGTNYSKSSRDRHDYSKAHAPDHSRVNPERNEHDLPVVSDKIIDEVAREDDDNDEDNYDDNDGQVDNTPVTDYYHQDDVREVVDEVPHPNIIEPDAEIMAEIGREGLVDEVGGIEAFVAEPVEEEANVVGVIRSDEEIALEERQRYQKFMCKAVSCIVALIVIIGVPVTLKLTNVIGPDEVTLSPTLSPSLVPSQSPSFMPTSSQFEAVIEKLLPISGEILRVAGSPQNKAARWITDVDQMDMNDPGFLQRYVMAVFFYALDGPSWKWIVQSQWLTNASECTWYGIETSPNCNGGCTADGKVCAIKTGHAKGITGQLPSEIGLLTEMRHIEIQSDGLFGTLPTSIGNWRKLNALLLNSNTPGLTGSLDILQTNELLGTIFVNGNRLNGTLDFLPSLTNLEWFEAKENSIGGTLPEEITGLKHLEIFNVNNNSMTGYLPSSWDETSLIKNLVFTDNNFKGPLPSLLGNVQFLEKLHASRNQLTGTMPQTYYNLENLKELYLDDNAFVGVLPQTAVPLYDGLQEISIHSNSFEGNFPIEHFEPKEILKVLSLHRNQLSGTITNNICQRLHHENPNKKLKVLSVDCDLIECTCCTCYINGTLV